MHPVYEITVMAKIGGFAGEHTPMRLKRMLTLLWKGLQHMCPVGKVCERLEAQPYKCLLSACVGNMRRGTASKNFLEDRFCCLRGHGV